MAYKHTGGGSALGLAAGETDAARADQGVQAAGHDLQILFQDGGVDGLRQIGALRRDAQQDVVAHAGAEQARDLGSVGGARRLEEMRRIGDTLTVPVDLAALRG